MNSETKGLSQKEAEKILSHDGPNTLAEEKLESALSLLFSQYKSIMTAILVFAAIFSLVIHEYLDAFFVFLVLIFNGIFGFIQEYRAQRTLQKLKELVIPKARVIRDGEEKEIDASELVVGDVVIISEGDRIQADGVLNSHIPLEIDESVFSGESLPVVKKDSDPVFSGTFVLQGRGQIKLTATGMKTKLGEIAQKITEIKKPVVPLAENLTALGKRLAAGAALAAVLLLPIGIFQAREFKELVLTSVSIAVAIIPEGLPLIVTIALAVGAYKMAKAKTIVRKMAAIETLGSTSVLLTDKTGTLTQNNMSVKKHWLPDPKKLPQLIRACTIANTASLAQEPGATEVLGDKTDGALLLFARQHHPNIEEFQAEGEVLLEKPFDPETKLIEARFKEGNTAHDFVRGAPESILKLFSGEKTPIEKKLQELSSEALRVIAFAYKNESSKTWTFLGFVGIYDPPREEVKEEILKVKQAGIRVVMVTGDNPVTALKISEEIGLIEKDELVVTYDEIAKLTDEQLLQKLPKIRVFARMKPEDKLRLVRLYKQAGAVVAVTGDGVNDALALSEAHIGVAMGERGTDVAKEAADVVLTDDNFATITRAVEEGRGIFDNILKTVIFLVSSNLVEFLVIFLGISLALPIPLTPTQILWINLIGDGFPAMALATDTKRKNLLFQKPRNISESILSKRRILAIAKLTIPFSLLLVAIYYVLIQRTNEHDAQFILFNLLVLGEMIMVFIIRGGIRPVNKFLFIAIGITLLLQWIIFVTPALRTLFS